MNVLLMILMAFRKVTMLGKDYNVRIYGVERNSVGCDFSKLTLEYKHETWHDRSPFPG